MSTRFKTQLARVRPKPNSFLRRIRKVRFPKGAAVGRNVLQIATVFTGSDSQELAKSPGHMSMAGKAGVNRNVD
jgi:hypothetical protein